MPACGSVLASRFLCAAEDEALYTIPGAADEMPPTQATYGEPRGPGHRGMDQIPLLATTGNDMSSKESVDMPIEAMTHPAVQQVILSYFCLCRSDAISVSNMRGFLAERP